MANPLLYAGARVALKATKLAAKGLKKVIAKNKAPKKVSKFAKSAKIARSKVQNNPALLNLKNQSAILKENRKQNFPLGNLPSAWSKIQKSTGAAYRNLRTKSKDQGTTIAHVFAKRAQGKVVSFKVPVKKITKGKK